MECSLPRVRIDRHSLDSRPSPSPVPVLRHSFRRFHRATGDRLGVGCYHRFPIDRLFLFRIPLSQRDRPVTNPVVHAHSVTVHEMEGELSCFCLALGGSFYSRGNSKIWNEFATT